MANYSHRYAYSASLLTLSDVSQRHWLSLPSVDFGDECDAVPFRDAMRYKYSVNKL